MKKPTLVIRYRVRNGVSQIHTGGPLRENYWSNFTNGQEKLSSPTYIRNYMVKRNPGFNIRMLSGKRKKSK